MAIDGLTPELVYEAILNAPVIFKKVRSSNPRTGKKEKLYIIKGMTFEGIDIYTKGKIISKKGYTYFMSLSPQSVAPISEPYPCPECGELGLVQVVETCRLSDGLTVKKLRHFKCTACSTRFFDDEAIHRIQSERSFQKLTV